MHTAKGSVGFVGLGLMGRPMATNLQNSDALGGHPLLVWNRSTPALDALAESGARAAQLGELAQADTLFFMLPDIPQITEALTPIRAAWHERFGTEDGRADLNGADLNGTAAVRVVVMSSVAPDAVRELGRDLEREFRGHVSLLDAPVSGGTAGAQAGTLSIMVGATEPDFRALRPLFDAMGSTVLRLGDLGAGSVAKACNQLLVGMTTAALAEASVVGQANGLDLGALFEVLGAGLAGSNVLTAMAPRMLSEDYTVKGPAKFMVKDLAAMRRAGQAGGVPVPLTEAGLREYEKVVARGLGDEDLSVVRKSMLQAGGAASGARGGTCSGELRGKLALVTGSSRGIGKNIAEGLAKAGARVVVHGRNRETIERTAAQLREICGAHAVATSEFDVTREDQVNAEIARIEREIGPIDILVNNAGVQHRVPMADLALEDWERVIATNLTSAFLVGRAVAKGMIGRGHGKIINIGSVQVDLARPTIGAYVASKGGVRNLTKAMCAEWAQHGIQANALAPGYIHTEMTQNLVDDDAFNSWITSRTPAARWGSTQDLVGPAVWLASKGSDFVNGQTIFVDGGMTAVV